LRIVCDDLDHILSRVERNSPFELASPFGECVDPNRDSVDAPLDAADATPLVSELAPHGNMIVTAALRAVVQSDTYPRRWAAADDLT
jgi:hypothetical protein